MLLTWGVVFVLVWMVLKPGSFSSPLNPQAEPKPITPRGDLASDEQATIALFKETSPSVVFITTAEVRQGFFSFDVTEIPRGAGTGFIWDREGHIVTNAHVIADADEAIVTLADQSQWRATDVGAALDKDLAVLKIDAPPERLKPIMVGGSSDLQVGQRVFAIGNPFGLDQTLTTGIVSALGREITSLTGRKIQDVIQTDAAINQGNSGGPLLDSAGRLIGVNTQIASPSGASAGVAFAIPVDTVNRVVPRIIRHGGAGRPALGIMPAPESIGRQLGVSRGVLVGDVAPNGPAARAGLQGTLIRRDGRVRLGDVIVTIDAEPVKDSNELLDVLEKHNVGDEVLITYLRDGREASVRLRLEAL